MARKSSADMEKTKLAILDAGLRLLQERGYHAVGIQEIAQEAGIPKGSFYNYFPSKEEFGAAVIRYYAEGSLGKWQAELAAAEKKLTAEEALYQVFLDLTEKYRCAEVKKGCLLGTLAAEISEVSEECRLALQEAIASFLKVLAAYLKSGQKLGRVRQDLDADRLAELVWDSWQGSLLRMKVEKSVEPIRSDLQVLFQTLLQQK